ncbi:hypothetical protein BOTBODRAFT_274668 [Botryobasidium botryosum FD-172 SS1]|uniref:UBX domain-containing protein n=1 Tax=Botryobasidium botryosum (strain FD-172 SS1) TaxID=930990 RepID=A0A067MJE5_BOTB1|nr:hypothetical protein BOTBODRAFT_274668 [Botryobasidium botryosum FD-172 SS1]
MVDQGTQEAHNIMEPVLHPSGDKGKSKEVVSQPAAAILDHDFKVWSPPATNSTTIPASSIPDSFFEPTTTELKVALAAQTRLRESLQNAPLKTQAIREQEEKKKHERWPNTTIRVKFPDQTQLEKVFPSTNTIKAIYAFVRNSLTEEAKPIKFVLYQTPPRRDYKVSDPAVKSLSLAQLSFAPSTILHLRFEDDALNSTTAPPPLLPAILERAVPLPTPQFDDANLDTANSKDSKGKAKAGGTSQGEKKIPKWFKMGQKK